MLPSPTAFSAVKRQSGSLPPIQLSVLTSNSFNVGVNLDHTLDHVSLRNLLQIVFGDILEGATYPRPIDTWVLNHGTGLVVGRMDSGEIHDFFVFSRNTGTMLTDSTDTSQNPPCGYGTGSDIDLDTVQSGTVVTASNKPGYKFTKVDVGAAPGHWSGRGQVRSGGSMPPKIEIDGGPQRRNWALGAYPASSPDTILTNILP